MSVFRTTDPLGRSIILKSATWQGKIVEAHPEMSGLLPLIRELIEDPYYILYDATQGDSDTHREEYWDLMKIREFYQIRALKTVVEFYDNEPERSGEIITAHIAGRVKGKTERGIVYERRKER